LEGFGGASALLHSAELGFDALGERKAALSSDAFHHFIHSAVGSNAESDGVLGHPGWGVVFADVSRVSPVVGAGRWWAPSA
jgi:hypothetical protein